MPWWAARAQTLMRFLGLPRVAQPLQVPPAPPPSLPSLPPPPKPKAFNAPVSLHALWFAHVCSVFCKGLQELNRPAGIAQGSPSTRSKVQLVACHCLLTLFVACDQLRALLMWGSTDYFLCQYARNMSPSFITQLFILIPPCTPSHPSLDPCISPHTLLHDPFHAHINSRQPAPLCQ